MPGRILVIDDDESIVALLDDLLTDEGYEVLASTTTLPDAVAVERLQPDLIILDYLMHAQPDGGRLLRQLQAWPATATIPVIVCTAAAGLVNDNASMVDQPIVRVLLKPFDVDDLLACIAALRPYRVRLPT